MLHKQTYSKFNFNQQSTSQIRRTNYGPYGQLREALDYCISPLSHHISEANHIYKYKDQKYDDAISLALSKCCANYKQHKVIDLFNNQDTMSKSIIDYNFNNRLKCQLYLCIKDELSPNEFDVINICYNDPAKNPIETIYQEHTDTIEIINEHGEKENKEIRVIDMVSIIAYMPVDILNINSQYRKNYEGAIKHELIHIFHEIKNADINIHAGSAYYYATQICQVFKVDWPLVGHFAAMLKKTVLTKSDIIQLLAGSLYYVNHSEYSAWLDYYNS